MKSRPRTVGIAAAALAVTILVLWLTGIAGLWLNGMASIVNNTGDYTDEAGSVMQGEHTVQIDLGNLSSNVGKELYHDGNYRIYVSSVDNTGSSITGGYRISFRSCGEYSLSGATLVSGARHETVGDHSFSTDMSANMTATYNGKNYVCNVFSPGGMIYKDGDYFAFYIFPGKAYRQGEVTLDEKGTVELSVTDLYKNVWVRKNQ